MAGMPASEVAPEEWGDEQGLNGLAISKPGSTSNMASMSKEEKEKEMARRREERKAVSRLIESPGVRVVN